MSEIQATDAEGSGFASSLMNGFRLIEAFSIEEPILGVTEISHKVGMHKSTVSRTLNALRQAGYVQKDPETGRFSLGLGVIRLAGPLLAHLDVRKAAYPALEAVTAATLETSALTVWNGHEAIVVEQVTSPRRVIQRAAIGTRYATFESSSVRVFLAHLPLDEAKAFYRSRVHGKSSLVASMPEFTEALEQIRVVGYAVNDSHTDPDELGISAPVRDYRTEVVGCITLSAPSFRVDAEGRQAMAGRVREAARSLSQALGYYRTAD